MHCEEENFFVKFNRAEHFGLFQTEYRALEALANTNTVKVPRPISLAYIDDQAVLAMEYLELANHSASSMSTLGQQLAALHRCTNECFGFSWDNFIGKTEQPNTWSQGWLGFFREYRLEFQLRLARQKGLAIPEANRLIDRMEVFFNNRSPAPSLLHGDLWGGNAGTLISGQPVLFDPAPYYGDRETDLAFTEMFGGFTSEFYEAYRESWPLEPGFAQRKVLYNLYHELNHFNIFGGSYGQQARGSVRQLLQWM